MESSVIAANSSHPMSHPHAGGLETARFLGRYPARVKRIQARVEDERALLTLAVATFQAEIAAVAA